jgi:TetR/AcrR family transcriptional repressor of nem operon
MGRPKEFKEEAVLDQAMEVFWAKGYEATSLHDLIGAMGISKSSFYETFGSKHELFVSAIEHYIDTRVGQMVQFLDKELSGKRAIEQVFRKMVESDPAQAKERGCMLCNCAVELAPRDPAAAQKVELGMEQMERAFYRAVVRGQEAGEISLAHSARSLARFLVNSANGMLVMAKASRGREVMSDTTRVILSVLG